MIKDYSSLESPIPWYIKIVLRIKDIKKPEYSDCITLDRIDYVSKRIGAAKNNLYLLGILIFAHITILIINKEIRAEKYISSTILLGFITSSMSAINSKLDKLRHYYNHFSKTDIYNESNEEFQEWASEFKNKEMKTGTMIFKISIWIVLIIYLFS